MATEGVEGCEGRVLPPPLPSAGTEDEERYRSPRMTASAWMTVLPPRMMCCVPWIWERREILLPVSYEPVAAVRLGLEGLKVLNGRGGGRRLRTVSMYSPLACLGGILAISRASWTIT